MYINPRGKNNTSYNFIWDGKLRVWHVWWHLVTCLVIWSLSKSPNTSWTILPCSINSRWHISFLVIENITLSPLQGLFFFKILFIYLFRQRGRGGEREGEKHQCVVASHMPPTGGLAHNPRHVAWLRIKPATLQFAGQHSIHWATPARVQGLFT